MDEAYTSKKMIAVILVVGALLGVLGLIAPMKTAKAVKVITVKVIHARTEKVYQHLPDGRVVEAYADIYYPEILVLQEYRNMITLGTVNITVHCNWTGPWGATVILELVDPGFRIGPTTFKPAVPEWQIWATGGCEIGPGAEIATVPGAGHYGSSATCYNVTLYPHYRYWQEARVHYGEVRKTKIFLGIRITLFDTKGEVIGGAGIIHVYTPDEYAPPVYLYLAEALTPVTASSSKPDPVAYAATAAMIILIGYTAYMLAARMKPRRRRPRIV